MTNAIAPKTLPHVNTLEEIEEAVALDKQWKPARPVTCNGCGLSCETPGNGRGQPGEDYGNHFQAWGGYSSPALKDCCRYRFSLCEHCLDALFQLFVVPPNVHDVGLGNMDYGPQPFEPAATWQDPKTYASAYWQGLRKDGAARAALRRFGPK